GGASVGSFASVCLVQDGEVGAVQDGQALDPGVEGDDDLAVGVDRHGGAQQGVSGAQRLAGGGVPHGAEGVGLLGGVLDAGVEPRPVGGERQGDQRVVVVGDGFHGAERLAGVQVHQPHPVAVVAQRDGGGVGGVHGEA